MPTDPTSKRDEAGEKTSHVCALMGFNPMIDTCPACEQESARPSKRESHPTPTDQTNGERKIDTGGPAFPRPISMLSAEEIAPDQQGMTMRDYFAAAVVGSIWKESSSDTKLEDMAIAAYGLADAMLNARKDQVQP